MVVQRLATIRPVAEKAALERTIRLAPGGPSGRVLVWIVTLGVIGVCGSLVVEAFLDESLTAGKRAVVILLALTASVSYGVVMGFARRWWAMESTLHVEEDRLVIDHPWYFKRRLSLPAEIIDFVAVDLPSDEFNRLALPRPPEFPVAWTVQNLPATKGQHLVPGEANLAVVFEGPVELPERRLLARQGVVNRVSALFGRAADPLQAHEALSEIATVRTLRSSDIPRISMPAGQRAALWFWSKMIWIGTVALGLGAMFALILYYPGK